MIGPRMRVPKIAHRCGFCKDDENKEIDFELSCLTFLTTKERFHMMLKGSEGMKKTMRKHGYGKSAEIIKRT
jgi:hypothetical protein